MSARFHLRNVLDRPDSPREKNDVRGPGSCVGLFQAEISQKHSQMIFVQKYLAKIGRTSIGLNASVHVLLHVFINVDHLKSGHLVL